MYRLLEPPRTITHEEGELARALAREFDRLTLLVADRPPDAPVPQHSLAARVLTRFCRLDPKARTRLHEWVKKAAPSGPQAPAEGGSAKPGRNIFDIDPALKTQARQLLRKRWDAQRSAIRPAIESYLSNLPRYGYLGTTTVEMQLPSETSSPHWFGEIHLATPDVLDFRWRTEEPAAARAYWQLTGPVTSASPGSVIASGYLPGVSSPEPVTGDAGIGGVFTIPFGYYLPPTAPQATTTYHVRVLPLGPPQRFRPFNPAGTPAGVGPWSAPAVIRYGREFVQPDQQFEIGEVFRKAHFFLDWIRLVEDQPGAGAEEFHVSGFIHHQGHDDLTDEIAPIRQQTFFGPYFQEIQPGDLSEHPFGRQATFHLNDPNTVDWPRTLRAIVSVLEEDDGGTLSDWQSSIDEIAAELMNGGLSADIDAFLNELREEIEEVRNEHTAALAAQSITVMAAALAASTRDLISAWIAMIVAWIAANIAAGAFDDFYGTRVYDLVLWTNEVDLVLVNGAGEIHASNVASGASTFRGSLQPDGSYRLDQTVMQFNGQGGPMEGSPVSGIVEIGVHWEFSDRDLR